MEGEVLAARPAVSASGRARALLALAVFGAAALVYWPAGAGQFLAYDDVVYVTGNPRVQAGLSLDSARWALFATETAQNWHPLTWLAHMLDVELFGLDPRGHHLSSVVWHALASSAFFLALASLFGAAGPALAAALFFALHPLRVEAVAHVADRKDLVAGVFAAASLASWLAWRRRGGAARLALASACFAAGLASKPTMLAWPLVLWLVDRPPFVPPARPARPRRLALAAFAALAAASAVPVWRAQSAAALEVGSTIAPALRAENALAALGHYARDTLWPTGLAVFYPHPALVGLEPERADVAAGALLLLGATAGAFVLRRARPEAWVGWGWWLAALLPVLGLVQVGMQARADRYTYLPSVGLSLALVALLWPVSKRPGARAPAAIGLAAVLVVLALAARRQISTWRDTRTVMEHALRVTERNFLAHVDLAADLEARGRPAEALEHLRAAIAIRPGMAGVERRAAELERLTSFGAGPAR
jgi:hypothetical protein